MDRVLAVSCEPLAVRGRGLVVGSRRRGLVVFVVCCLLFLAGVVEAGDRALLQRKN
ncbi:MAG: hypothetical protein KJ592_03805 [Nanoarchaeota archaeon]|nr:hypothetical protein [Nanoarchaeota archaeon]